MKIFKFSNLMYLKIFSVIFCFQFSVAALAECIVDTSYNCEGDNKIWSSHSPIERGMLQYSFEVQNVQSSCELYAKVLALECGIQRPIKILFGDDVKKWSQSFILSVDPNTFSDKSKLPRPFQDYFSGINKNLVKAVALQQSLGNVNLNIINSLTTFMASDNSNDSIEFSYPCTSNITSVFSCNYNVKCIQTGAFATGDKIRIEKKPSLSICKDEDQLKQVVSAIEQLKLSPGADPRTYYKDQTRVTNYAGFKHMPLLNQSDAWLAGLFLDKYNTDYTQTGVCLSTSATMMALALKKESPGSVLKNRFDVVPNEYGDGVAIVKDPNNASLTKELKYSHHSVYVDEMLRWAGMLDGGRFPSYLDMYKKVFHKSAVVEGRYLPLEATSTDAAYSSVYANYLANVSLQTNVEQNYKSWISSKRGLVLALQSTGLVPTAKFFEGLIGHASTVASYSGDTITLLDPWGVVSQVKFNVHNQTIGVTQMAEWTECKTAVEGLSAELKKIFTVLNTCGVVPNGGFALREADPRKMRVLEQVGTERGYFGKRYLGVQNWYTGAYINGYISGDPWPVPLTVDDSLNIQNLVQSKSTTQTCSPITQGEIAFGGNWYRFNNPMPFVKATSSTPATIYSSTTPVVSGCSNLYKVKSNGETELTGEYHAGQFEMTCINGKISITKNNCQKLMGLSDCPTIANSYGGFYLPTLSKIGLQDYYPNQGKCTYTCEFNYSYNSTTNKCVPLAPTMLKYSKLEYNLPLMLPSNVEITAATNYAKELTFTITPALPSGLVLNTTTGAITGTPKVAQAMTAYTITAKNISGQVSTSIKIAVTMTAPLAFRYLNSPLKVGRLSSVNLSRTSGGGASVVFATVPKLPSGLMINSSTGLIFGNPQNVQVATNYTVTATNAVGQSSTVISIEVYDLKPTSLSYSVIAETLKRGQSYLSASSTLNGGTRGGVYSINPALPTGITLNASTGIIMGTPSVDSELKSYEVRYTNSAGFVSHILKFEVLSDLNFVTAVENKLPVGFVNQPVNFAGPTFTSFGKIGLSYALVSGVLPPGLTFNTTTGSITGTPTSAYNGLLTIQAKNKISNRSFSVNLVIHKQSPLSLEYNNSGMMYLTLNTPYTNSPILNNPAGYPVSYSVTPALPPGLTLNPSTGVISGQLTSYVNISDHRVTATNSYGSVFKNITVGIYGPAPTPTQPPPANLKYLVQPVFEVNKAISMTGPTYTGSGNNRFTISPSLPMGLVLNELSGAISGTPLVVTYPITYKVTLSNQYGSTTYDKLLIEVRPTPTPTPTPVINIPPSDFAYPPLVTSYFLKDRAITPHAPVLTSTQTAGVQFSVSPPLPNGLILNPQNGEITGIPMLVTPMTTYTIKATNSYGVKLNTITFEINELSPSSISYRSTFTFPVGRLISNAPRVSGGMPHTFKINPQLPVGLNFDIRTGVISGSSVSTLSATDFEVTALNNAGSAKTIIRITVTP